MNPCLHDAATYYAAIQLSCIMRELGSGTYRWTDDALKFLQALEDGHLPHKTVGN